MIIYDQSRFGGWGIIFHVTGSALFSYKSFVPALLSAILSGVIANVPTVLEWFAPKVLNGSVIFSSIQFLVSLIVVNRVREAGSRFSATQEAYIRFYSSLLNLAFVVTAAIDNSKNQPSYELYVFRTRFLRWCRALHVLAVEEFVGYEAPQFRIGTLLFTEEVLLFRERRKPTRMLHWMFNGVMKERAHAAWDASIDSNVWRLLTDVCTAYASTRRMSAQIYPFPLAQSSLICCICFGIFSPFAFGTMLPASYFLAPCVAFVSVWLTFGFNLAAEMLEWPFDGRANNLPMNHYSIRFINDISMIEYATVSPIVSLELDRLIPPGAADDLEYDIPKKRPWDKKVSTRAWLEKAKDDFAGFHGRRNELRHRLRAVDPKKRAFQQEHDILGEGVTELRARGMFKKLA